MKRAISILVMMSFLSVKVEGQNSNHEERITTKMHANANNAMPNLILRGWRENWGSSPNEGEFTPGGYRRFIDLCAEYSKINLIKVTLRTPNRDVTDKDVHEYTKEAVAYARGKGIGIAMDPLDVRHARLAFQKAYPDELIETLRLRELSLPAAGQIPVVVEASRQGANIYTLPSPRHLPRRSRLVRVYSYVTGKHGIEPETVEDITDRYCEVKAAGSDKLEVVISCGEHSKGRQVCVMAAFTHNEPDMFSPHLIDFQHEIFKQYADLDLAGTLKDEWGFPHFYGDYAAHSDFWFSRFMAEAYSRRTGGRDLARDCLLMSKGERGRQGERQAAINHFTAMIWQRSGAIEHDFYLTTKATFGASALVGGVATWWQYPDEHEFKRNGLHWWAATRDIATIDTGIPYCIGTSLAKKWGRPVFYDEYFSTISIAGSIENAKADYCREIWAHALAGGRISWHPVYPGRDLGWKSYEVLFQGDLMRGDCRIRLLDFISKAPIDCPVAVIFGHACAMNWAGPGYNDVGIGLTDEFWRAGYYADLIPTSEINTPALKVSPDGYVQYGPQRYAAAVLYHPEFENPETAGFFKKAVQGKTALYRLGDWTTDFNGKPFAGNAALPPEMTAVAEPAVCAQKIIARLQRLGIAPQTPATNMTTKTEWGPQSSSPPAKGNLRLIDGTRIMLAGEKQTAGDPIQTTLEINGCPVEFDAVGVAGARISDDGILEAMAAGGLKHFRAGGFKIDLDERADVALWRNESGKWQGVLQDWEGPVPSALMKITPEWKRLSIPKQLTNDGY